MVEKDAKTDAGMRTLPQPVPVLKALKAFKATQAAERLAAGEGYEESGTSWWTHSAAPSRRTSCAARRTS